MTYTLTVGGAPVNVSEARVSAVPFNRVWPGSQRPTEQTEKAFFSTFDMTSPVDILIEVQGSDVRDVEIRPKEFGIPFEVCGNVVKVHLDKPRKFSVEVNGYHEALHVFANKPCEYKPEDATVYFGKGEHHAGLILPEDGDVIFIDEGAVVYGAVYAYKKKNVKIVGRGVLDGSLLKRGNECSIEENEVLSGVKALGLTDRDVIYYSMFNAYGCEDLTVDGIILKDAPLWTVILRNQCKNVTLNNVKLIGMWRYNSDGIDICSSSGVTVSDCYVRSFDDCLVVRGSYLDGEEGGCSDVTVKDNVLWCDWGKNIEIWCGDKDTVIENIRFERNFLPHICHNAISIDTWGGHDRICVRNVRYKDIFVDTSGELLRPVYQASDDMEYAPDVSAQPRSNVVYITVGRVGRHMGNQQFDETFDTSAYEISYTDIHFEHIKVSGGMRLRTYIDRSRLKDFEDVTFSDCDLGDITLK